MRLWIIAIALVALVACGGGEASTAISPTLPDSVEKSTVASQSPATSATRVDEAVPVGALAHFEAGVALQEIGHLAEAIAEYDVAIRLNPQYAMAFVNRGAAYLGQGQGERAIQDLDEAIRLDSQLAMAYNNRGRGYEALGRNERAIVDYDEAIRLDPEFSLAHANRSLSYFYLGKDDEAQQDIEQAQRLGFNRGMLRDFMEEGGKAAEWGAVQSSIDLMIADNKIRELDAAGTTAQRIDQTAVLCAACPANKQIANYLGEASTNYCYTWDATGKLLTQADC